jgi:hypothetical protein
VSETLSSTDTLDKLEDALISLVVVGLRPAMPEITRDQARNLVSKIGIRIAFPSKQLDDALVGRKLPLVDTDLDEHEHVTRS